MSFDPDWLVPFRDGAAPFADPRWSWDSVSCVGVNGKGHPLPRAGYRTIVKGVRCPSCSQLVGRVEVRGDDVGHPTWVTWIEGGHAGVMRVVPGQTALITEGPWKGHREPVYTLSFWEGRFSLTRDGERAPEALWFRTPCMEHGEVDITAAELFRAIAAHHQRIAGTIHP